MTDTAAILRAFTPTGRLRASINLGDPVLADRSACDLSLARALQHAQIVRAPTAPASAR